MLIEERGTSVKMRLSTGWMLAPVVFGFGLVGDWASAEPTVTIETEYLMTLEAPLDPAFQVVGQRVIVDVVAGGTVHGPKINGTLIPPSGDWLIPMPDGSTRLDVRTTIRTDEGELIFVEYNGVIFASKEVNDRFGKGEVITSDAESVDEQQ